MIASTYTCVNRAIIASLCALILFVPAGKEDIFGREVRFRDFQEDRDRLERTARSVKEEERLDNWERTVESGREALRAEWERDATEKIDKALLEEGEEAALRAELERRRDEALSQWEREADSFIAEEKGEWYASRQELLNLAPDGSVLKELLSLARKAAEGKEGMDALESWDEAALGGKESLEREAEAGIAAWATRLRAEGAALDAAARESYDREIERIIEEVRRAYHLEANMMVYRERNGVIADLFFDTSSLKYQSGDERARAAYDLVKSEIDRKLAEEEAKITEHDTDIPKGADALDIEKLAGAWKEEMERLVTGGLEIWKKAQEELLGRMNAWRVKAAAALEEGEKAWDEARAKLEHARDEWRERILEEIGKGLAEWEAKENELAENIRKARDELTGYLLTEQESWNGQKKELFGMATDGLTSWGEARETKRWLDEQVAEYGARGYLNTLAQEDLRELFSDQANTLITSMGRNKQQWITDCARCRRDTKCGHSHDQYDRWQWFSRECERASNRWYFDEYATEVTITPEMMKLEDRGEAPGPHLNYTNYDKENGILTEVYTIRINARLIFRNYQGNDHWDYDTGNTIITLWKNVITPETATAKKTRLYYYINEQQKMTAVAANLDRQLDETEGYLHSHLMRGEDGGAGYLVNADGTYGLRYAGDELSKDPYLMTGAEERFELARRERDFWEKRLMIAEDVLKYASPELYGADNPYAPGGRRESADVTGRRVEETKAALEAALSALDEARAAAEGLVARMTAVKNEFPGFIRAAGELYPAVAEAREEYEEKKAAAILAGDAVTSDMLQEVEDAGRVLKETEDVYDEAVRKVEESRVRYEALNNEYRAAMDAVSTRSGEYKEAEFVYERAYAVWEYANTPYLMDAAVKAPGLESGILPGEGMADYGAIQIPDAKEYYDYVLGIYTGKNALFEKARTAMERQETVETLLSDESYTAARNLVLQAMEGGAPPEDLAAALGAYLDHGFNEAYEGRHDLTVVLREEEEFLWYLSRTAKGRYAAALETGDEAAAVTARGLYEIIMNLLVHGVDDAVVQRLMAQNEVFQEEEWAEQQNKFSLRRQRWAETVGFVMNRGEREWQLSMAEFNREMMSWRNNAEKEIEKGEKEYAKALEEFNREMLTWQRGVAKKESTEAAKQAVTDAEKKAAELLKRLGLTLPGGLNISVDVDALIAKWPGDSPAGLGALEKSMENIDTAALFNGPLGLDGGLALLRESYARQMDEFSDRMETMRTVRMAESVYESFQAMIARFHEQLGEVNTMSYDVTGNDIRGSFDAPFNRETDRNAWSIRVIKSRSLVSGSKRETISFDDWLNYVYSLPLLKPLRSLEGGEIDFENPYTYENLSISELEAYVKIEEELMQKEMERILGEGGEFTRHQNDEFTRLQNEFSSAYGKYQKGRALGKMNWYSLPVVPGGPSGIMVGTLAAGIIGGPWAAFAASTLFTTIQMADGSMKWEQGAFNIATSAATTGLTFGANSFIGGFQGQLAGTLGSTLMGGFEMSPTGKLSYEYDKFGELDTWQNVGINLGVSTLASSMNNSSGSTAWGKLQGALLSGTVTTVGTKLTTDDWDWAAGMGNALGSYAGDRLGMGGSYTNALINNFTSFAAREMLGSNEKFSWDAVGQVNALQLALNDTFRKPKPSQKKKEEAQGEKPFQDPVDMPGATKGHNDTETLLSGLWTSIRNGFVNTGKQITAGIEAMGRGVMTAWNGMSEFVGNAVNRAAESLEALFAGSDNAANDLNKAIEDERIRVLAIQSASGLPENSPIVEQIKKFKEENPDRNVYDYLLEQYKDQTGGRYDNAVASETLSRLAKEMGMTNQEFKDAFSSNGNNATNRINGVDITGVNPATSEIPKNTTSPLGTFFEKVVNVFSGDGWRTDREIAIQTATDAAWKQMAVDEAWGYMTAVDAAQNEFMKSNLNLAELSTGTRLPVTAEDYAKGNGITTQYSDVHPGIDISLYENTEIFAEGYGTVTRSRWQDPEDNSVGYGQYMVIDYGNGVEKLYGHLNQRNYQVGDRVRYGDVLALSGNTGYSSGPHLHYEVKVNGRYVNPFKRRR